jgi:cytochrome c biogenesis protein CcmG/thiol:disulfide interchange protein DsbE
MAGLSPPTSRRRRTVIGAVAVGLAVAGLVALLATAKPIPQVQAESALVGRPAPAVAGSDLTRPGSAVSLQSLRGRFVVVNFFASWCVSCRQEQAQLEAFQQQQSRLPGGATLLGVVFNESSSDAAAYLRSTGATWPAVGDQSGLIALNYGVTGPPEDFVVSPGGTVVAHVDGPVSAGLLNRLIAKAEADGY